ncbi:PDR/VanB family oxidoreductase [Gordonia sp. CPCC 205333]|uniref:PDR/VanB family oxidoreductase n=1 Tax=Gordonia sp. CPCC 205333 TaxID=3140790 RepID=UPI003AF3BB1C
MMSRPTTETIEGRRALLHLEGGVPPSFYANFKHDPVLIAFDALVGPAVRLFGRLSPTGTPPQVVDRTIELCLVERRSVAADHGVVSFTFSGADGAPLPAWRPGAHIDMMLPSGRIRHYSLCGDFNDRGYYRVAVRRISDGGGGSIEMHDNLRVGDRIRARTPRNVFPLVTMGQGDTEGRRLHFIAGGIGITPILSMLGAADQAGVDWTMTYTGRSPEGLPFLDELEPYGERVAIRTDDESGLPSARDLLPDVHSKIAVYCCGPAPMMELVRADVQHREGVEFHSERFSRPPIVNGQPFDIQLGKEGEILSVPADRSILEVVRESRPLVSYSCEQGYCQNCKIKTLGGEIDHRDNTLNDAQREQNEMLICVSRAPRGEQLVLDIQ